MRSLCCVLIDPVTEQRVKCFSVVPESRIRQTDEETENEEDGDDFLDECLSSLSVTEWDDDTFSDL